MTILLTGASGNVGSHVLPELVRRGYSVRTFETLTEHRKRAPMAGVESVWGDVTDPAAVARAVEGVDTVIHLAALIPPAADEQPERAREVNVDGTVNVIAACSCCNLKKGNMTMAEARMWPSQMPFQPSVHHLHRNGRLFPPNYLHESWLDYLYWDTELEP